MTGTRVECPICSLVMVHAQADHVGVYDGLDSLLTLDGDTGVDFCRKCGVLVVGFDSELIVN